MKIIGIDDSKKEIRKINKKKITYAIIITTIFIIFLTLFCIYVGNRNFRDFIDKYVLMKNVKEDNLLSITLNDNENNNVYAYDKYISVLNKNVLTGYNSNANKEYELTVEITNPIVDTNNRFLLLAEKSGQKIYLISGENVVWEKKLDGNITKISVNKNGYVSVILSGTSYKSVIETYDETGKLLFKTYLSSTIAMDSAISNDNKYLSFVEISANGTLIQSTIKTVSIQKAKEQPSESIIYIGNSKKDSIALSLKYQDSNKLICMYDNEIDIINNNEEEKILDLIEDGKKIGFSDIRLNNFVFRVTERSNLLNTKTILEIMNPTNKKINQYEIDGVIKEAYCYKDTIALNLGSEVHFVGTNGWLIKKYTSSQELKNIVINDSSIGIVYKDKVEIINL